MKKYISIILFLFLLLPLFVYAGKIKVDGYILSDKLITVTTYTTAGINAAIDALGTEGGEVYLPEGTYVCTDGVITIDYANTTLTGAGKGTILDFSAGQGGSPSGIDVGTVSHTTIQGISFLGNAGGGDNDAFIGFGPAAPEYLTVQNCWFTDGDDLDIVAPGEYARIINNHFTNTDVDAIYLHGNYATVTGNVFKDIGRDAIMCYDDFCVISNNVIEDCAEVGIHVTGGSYNVIEGNTIEDVIEDGIYIENSSRHNTVIGNVIYSTINGSDNITIYNSSDYNNILNNMCSGSVVNTNNKGIHISAADHCIVAGNLTRYHDEAGIKEESNCEDNLIYGNSCWDTVPYILSGATPADFIVNGKIKVDEVHTGEIHSDTNDVVSFNDENQINVGTIHCDGFMSDANNGISFNDENTTNIGEAHLDSIYSDGNTTITIYDAVEMPETTVFSNQTTGITLGDGTQGIDFRILADGNAYDGSITYMENEDRWDFDNDVDVGGDLTAGTIEGSSYKIEVGIDAEATDAYVVDLDPNLSAYSEGLIVWFDPNNPNVGACTLRLTGGLAAKAIKTQGHDDPANDYIEADSRAGVIYNATGGYWMFITPDANP